MTLEELVKVAASIPFPKRFAQKRGRGGGNDVPVGVDDVDGRSGGAECVGDDVAGDGGAGEENALTVETCSGAEAQLNLMRLRHE